MIDIEQITKQIIIKIIKEQNEILLNEIGNDMNIDIDYLISTYLKKEYYLPIFTD